MKKITLKSFCKINLYLKVISLRKDNYHNIETIFERISLFDKVSVRLRKDGLIKISSNSQAVPCDARNFCYKAAKLLQDEFKISKGADIFIDKRLPIASGLGAGSANAAATLIALNKIWDLRLSQAKIRKIARKVGADVAFFTYDTAFAIGRERGDKIYPLRSLSKMKLWHVLVVLHVGVSTPAIYQEWDRLKSLGKLALTSRALNAKITNSALRKGDPLIIGKGLFNSLEEVTTRIYPQINVLKEKLKALKVKAVMMSGSGPTVFGIVSSKKQAEQVAKSLKQKSSWKVFVASTC